MNPAPLTVTTPNDLEVVMTRSFNAPRRMVFDAWTKPELVRRWLLGPQGWTMPVCEIDPRPGGHYRHVWRNEADGREFGTGGIFREFVVPERTVSTEKMDGMPGEALVTNVLTEHDSRTTSTMTMRFESKAARDGALASGMDRGVEESFKRLDAILTAVE